MSYPKKLVLLGLPVTVVAVYLLQGWSVSNEIPSFNPVKPSELVEVAQPYREKPSSLYIPGVPTSDEYVPNEGTGENLSQDGDHVFVERPASTQAFATTTERTTQINDAHQRRTSTQTFSNTAERNNDPQYSTADQAVESALAQSAPCDKPPRDAGIDELLRRYRHCMGRLVALALQDGKLSPTPLGEQSSSEGLGMLSDEGWRGIAGRLASVKRGCRVPAVEFTGAPNLADVVFDRTHHLAYCRHGKAATSSLLSFMMWLNHDGPTTPNFVGVHNKIFQYLPRPTRESQKDLLKRSFVFTAVRHPFRRLVSAYCNKEVEMKLKILPYEIRMKSPEERELELLEYNYKVKSGAREPTVMAGPWIRRAITDQSLPEEGQKDGSLLAHYLSAVDFNSTLNKNLIEPTTDIQGVLSEGGRHQSTQKLPSSVEPFRMYVHGVALQLLSCRGDTSCLGLVNRHINPQVIRWNPCILNFDMVMKVETLDQDIVLLKDLLGLGDPLAEGENTTRKVEEIPKEWMEEEDLLGLPDPLAEGENTTRKVEEIPKEWMEKEDLLGLPVPLAEGEDTTRKVEEIPKERMEKEDLLGLHDPLAEEEDTTRKVEEIPKEWMEKDLNPRQIQKKLRSRRAVAQSDDDAGLEKKASKETQTHNEIDGFVIIENQVGKTIDSGGHYELSEEKVTKVTPGAKSEFNWGSGFFKRNKSDPKCGTYEENMRQLSQRDIDLLYTCYYWDFKLFGYEPFD